jgi:DGQHR domain-containing protein
MELTLKASFTRDEIALAAAIGADTMPLSQRVVELFSQLPDPQLSSDEIRSLLGLKSSEDLEQVLAALCTDKTLERSDKTVRPLDDDGITLYRRGDLRFERLRLAAVESELNDGTTRYQFTCDGRLIRSIARVDRLDTLTGTGNQRDEVRNHVEQIAKGIEHGTQIPNSILLVLLQSQTVEWDPLDEDSIPGSFIVVRPVSDWISVPSPSQPERLVQRFRNVEIDFPFRKAAFDDEKSAIIVDGQQRTAGLSLVDIEKVPTFALSVNAIAANPEQAKRIFQVANTTVKISTQFSRALMATMGEAPGYLRTERSKAIAAKILAIDDAASPFYNLVQYPGVKLGKTRPPIVYNSLFQVLSAFSDSGLPLDSDPKILALVTGKAFALVKATWPEAWALKPTESKLMHGVGLRAMASLLVNKIETRFAEFQTFSSEALWRALSESLQRLQHRVVWTDAAAGEASTAVKKIWREQISNRQNTNQDISALSSWLKKESLDLDVRAQKPSKAGA